MQLRVAPESNSALTLLPPTVVLYVKVCVSLICIDSISAVPVGAVAAVWLVLGGLWT